MKLICKNLNNCQTFNEKKIFNDLNNLEVSLADIFLCDITDFC